MEIFFPTFSTYIFSSLMSSSSSGFSSLSLCIPFAFVSLLRGLYVYTLLSLFVLEQSTLSLERDIARRSQKVETTCKFGSREDSNLKDSVQMRAISTNSSELLRTRNAYCNSAHRIKRSAQDRSWGKNDEKHDCWHVIVGWDKQTSKKPLLLIITACLFKKSKF
jgi:hypothetical protein